MEQLGQIGPLVAELGACNPFTRRRIELEERLAEALGAEGMTRTSEGAAWNESVPTLAMDPRLSFVLERMSALVEGLRVAGPKLGGESAVHWRECVLFTLFHRNIERMDALIAPAMRGGPAERRFAGHRAFGRELRELCGSATEHEGVPLEEGVVLGLFFQIRRAFHMIHHHLVGGSGAMVALRAAIWEAIFTHDLRRYRRVLRGAMEDFPTLITGPSGSGKELVARAIALSGHVPFDAAAGVFARDFTEDFLALNLAALPENLIESELFGHRRGSFTGAVADRVGWMERCPAGGVVFLDEIGEAPALAQVKLLRVLQTRSFQRIGETDTRRFAGRILAATHRDLGREIAEGRFREDFHFRLCSVRVRTPSLAEQLAGSRAELRRLCGWVCGRLVPEAEARRLADGLAECVEGGVGLDYAWPGNFRELEQAARMYLVSRRHEPLARPERADGVAAKWAGAWLDCGLSADEVLGLYCRRALELSGGNAVAAAKRLGLDRRTVLARGRGMELTRSREGSKE